MFHHGGRTTVVASSKKPFSLVMSRLNVMFFLLIFPLFFSVEIDFLLYEVNSHSEYSNHSLIVVTTAGDERMAFHHYLYCFH